MSFIAVGFSELSSFKNTVSEVYNNLPPKLKPLLEASGKQANNEQAKVKDQILGAKLTELGGSELVLNEFLYY